MKQFQNRKHADVLAEDEDVGVTHYLYNIPTYPNKQELISPCKDHLHKQIGNEDIHEMQTKDYEKKDWSPKSRQNCESYRHISEGFRKGT